MQILKRLDIFDRQVPAFSIGGKNSVSTWTGTSCTVFIFTLTFAFGLVKLQHLLERKNPIVTNNTERLEAFDSYSLGSDEFMMAFTLHPFTGEALKYDPRYVRWIVRTWTSNEYVKEEKFLPLHLCT